MMRYREFPENYFKMAFRYYLYGAVPAAVILLYCKLFIGPAELHDYDPEVYEPDHHEFFQHPATRFMAKYFKEDPKITYYRKINRLEKSWQNYQQRQVISQAQTLQQINKRGYFFIDTMVVEDMHDYEQLDEYANRLGLKSKAPNEKPDDRM